MKNKIFLFIVVLTFFMQPYFHDLKSELLQEKKDQENLQHEVMVRLILVDVTVTKDREFVTDLSKDDFELYEDGKMVSINSFELISFAETKVLTSEEKEERIPSAVPKKKLAVVFDGINTLPRHFKRGNEKIVNELVELVKLGHEVMIIQLDRRRGVEIVQPFTLDEQLIERAVARAAGDIWVEKSLDVLKMRQDVDIEGTGEQAQAQREIGGSEQEQALMFEEWYFKKQRFEKSIGGILAVFSMIKDLPGRKTVLLISDGLPSLSPKGVNTSINITGTAGQMSGNIVSLNRDKAGYGTIGSFDPFNILGKKHFLKGDDVIRGLTHFANAQNISVYTLDPGTFTEYFFTVSGENDPSEIRRIIGSKHKKINQVQNLRWLSEETGAAWLRGAKKYDAFRQVISTDLNYYYQLSFYPQRKEADNAYHEIEVKVKRKVVDVRFRKGYTDYSEDQGERMLLVTAYYNPSIFKDIPFEAEFILFHKESNKYEPWMNVALPVKELFLERKMAYGPKTFDLHVWIKEIKKGDKAFGGQITLPFNIDSSFLDSIKSMDYLGFHSKGPEIDFSEGEYQVIFAVFDPQTNEVGTWEAPLSLPDLTESREAAIMNCVLGYIMPNPEGGADSFSLSRKDGSLEYGEIKFFPAIINRFQLMQDVSLFLQVLLPQGRMKVQPIFQISKDGISQVVQGELIAESWNERSNVWSGIFNLDLSSLSPGDYALKLSLPVYEEGPVLSREVKLIKLRY